MIDEVRFVNGFKALEGEGWSGAVANQAFHPDTIVGRDADLGTDNTHFSADLELADPEPVGNDRV